MQTKEIYNILTLLGPVIVVLIAYIAAENFRPEPKLTPIEQTLLGFSDSIPEIKAYKDTEGVNTDANLPFKIRPQAPASYPPVLLSEMAPQGGQKEDTEDLTKLKLSVVVISGQKKIALLNNHVLREGDTYNHIVIEKIEQDKVLVSTKQQKTWLKVN